MEIKADRLKFENKKGKLHAELNFLGVAASADGEVRARFSDALKLDFDNPSQVETLKGKSLHYEKEFKIAPGQYTFTVTFRSRRREFWKATSAARRSIPGPVISASAAWLSARRLIRRPIWGWPGVWGWKAARRWSPQGVQVVPSGSVRFAKSEPAFFYFEAYGPSALTARVRVRVLDRKTGDQKWDGGSFNLTAQGNAGKLPVDSLATGSYQLEVTATDSAGKEVKRTADFEII